MLDVVANLVLTLTLLLAKLFGGSVGLGLATMSIGVRIAMLPLTLRLARHAAQQRALAQQIQPELERVRKRYATDPERQAREMAAIYRNAGIRPFTVGTIAGLAIQWPVLGGVFQAIRRGLGAGSRFLWVLDLGKPDVLMAGVAALLTVVSIRLGEPRGGKLAATIISAALTFWLAWRASAAMALYWASSSIVGAGQALLLRRDSHKHQ